MHLFNVLPATHFMMMSLLVTGSTVSLPRRSADKSEKLTPDDVIVMSLGVISALP